MPNQQTQIQDKPYFIVPFIKPKDPKEYKNLDRRFSIASGYCGVLNVTITVQTPLIFGQGDLAIQPDGVNVVHALSRENGSIALAGSSFKGELRSFFECITPSCVLLSKERTNCKIANGEICPACAVFGGLGLKGKLRFSSFIAHLPVRTEYKVVPQLWSPRIDNHPGRKLYKHSKILEIGTDAIGFNYECLPIKSELTGHIFYEGLTYEELSALLFALGLGWEKPIYHKLGYAKPAYYGSVKIDVTDGNGGNPLSSKPQDSLETLASNYRQNADADLLQAIRVIETYWSDLNGPNQWKTVGANRVY